MQNWTQFLDDEIYVVDLLQLPSGVRQIAPRQRSDDRSGAAVMTTHECSGSVIKQFLKGQVPFDSVTATDGTRFVLDAHHHWITLAEYEFLQGRDFNGDAFTDPSAPWFNGIPPQPVPI